MQLYYVKDAKLISFADVDESAFFGKRPEPTKLLLNGHYVTSGNNLVLLIRRYDKGNLFTIDDESYEKLTIEIKKYTVDIPIKFDSPEIHFYYSSGSCGFVSKGHGVYSTSGSGNLIIKKVEEDNIVVKLDFTSWAEPAGSFPFEGKKIKVQGLLSFKEKKVANLTPWLGVPDSSSGKEVYP